MRERFPVHLPHDKHLRFEKVTDVSHWRKLNVEWGGVREKFILYPPNSSKWYLIKFPKYGMNEIFVELFNCTLALNLGLKPADYFPCKYMGKYGIITPSFLQGLGRESELWEMKELLCHYSNEPNIERKMGRDEDVLREHNIDSIFSILGKEFGERVLPDFFRMIGLDCLIGHGDRHWCNYGVILHLGRDKSLNFKFAPIYDTASGYLLEHRDKELEDVVKSGKLDDEKWYMPRIKGLCKITVQGNPKTNHVELFKYILDEPRYLPYRKFLIEPLGKFDIRVTRKILDNYFTQLSSLRKNAIIKILDKRHKILSEIVS